MQRRYQTLLTMVRISEFLGWFVIAAGVVLGIIVSRNQGIPMGLGVFVIGLLVGFGNVILMQFIMMLMDIENNTHQLSDQIDETNSMLRETLGPIAVLVRKISEKGE